MHKLAKYAFLAAIALTWIPVQASAQLTLDDFTYGHYVKRINNPQLYDLHYEALPPNSLMGAARQTDFRQQATPTPSGAHLTSAKAIS